MREDGGISRRWRCTGRLEIDRGMVAFDVMAREGPPHRDGERLASGGGGGRCFPDDRDVEEVDGLRVGLRNTMGDDGRT